MKRYISLACVALIVVMCLVNPVSAAETSVGAVDLLSLGYIEANGTNVENFRINLAANRTGSIWFPVDLSFALGKFELLIITSDPTITFSRSDGAVTYTTEQSPLGDNYYVVKGDFSGRGKTLNYTSSGTSSSDYCFIVSAKAVPIGYSVVEVPFNLELWDASSGTLLDGDEYTYRYEFWDDPILTEYDGILARQIRIYPDKEDLAGLDYFDLDLYMQNLEIDSISASFGGNALDILYTETIIGDGVISDPFTDGAFDRSYAVYKVVIRVDVSGINLLDGLPTVFITYNSNNIMNVRPYLYVYGINAGKFWSSTEPEVTFLYRIWNSVTTGFSNVGTWLSTLGNNITSNFDRLGVWVTNLISSNIQQAQNIITSLSTNFDTYFTKLGVWFANQNTLLSNKFNDLHSMISSKINDLHTMMVNKFDALEAAIRGDTGPGDKFQDEVDQKDQQLENMADVMESVTQPALDSINVAADSMVDPNVLAVSMSGLTSVIGDTGSIFYQMIVMSIMMSTAGFVLFGKR